MMQVTVKRLHVDATIPTYATDGSGCFDIYATNVRKATLAELEVLKKFAVGYQDEIGTQPMPPRHGIVFDTGLAFEVPKDHVMLVFSRSGHGFKNNVRLSNCVGVIDSDYRGELKVKLASDDLAGGRQPLDIKTGDRIAQALIIPITKVLFKEVDELTSSDRGEGGFGSTGS